MRSAKEETAWPGWHAWSWSDYYAWPDYHAWANYYAWADYSIAQLPSAYQLDPAITGDHYGAIVAAYHYQGVGIAEYAPHHRGRQKC